MQRLVRSLIIMKYLVKNTFKYTSDVWVEADTAAEAKDLAGGHEDQEINNDDTWYDAEVIDSEES